MSAWKNCELVSYPRWRVLYLHWLARCLGVLIHVEGIPFGRHRPRLVP